MGEQKKGNEEHKPKKPYTGWDIIASDPQIREFYSILTETLSQHPGGLKEALSSPVNTSLAEIRGTYITNTRERNGS
jgi:hypothetical protein